MKAMVQMNGSFLPALILAIDLFIVVKTINSILLVEQNSMLTFYYGQMKVVYHLHDTIPLFHKCTIDRQCTLMCNDILSQVL